MEKVCPICRETTKLEDLKTQEQRNEFYITGLCAPCQDNLYGATPGRTGERESKRGGEIEGSNNWKKV